MIVRPAFLVVAVALAVPGVTGAQVPSDEAFIEGLLETLAAPNPLEALGGAVDTTVARLAELLARGSADEQLFAAYALAFMGEAARSAVPALLDAAASEDADVRYNASRTLRILAPPEAEAAFENLLGDRDLRTRVEAAYGLARLQKGSRERILAVLEEATRNRDAVLSQIALGGLSWVEPYAVESIPAIMDAFRKGSDATKLEAAMTLSVVDPVGITVSTIDPAVATATVATLENALHHDLALFRQVAATALGNLGKRAVDHLEAVRALENDPDPGVRESASAAVERIELPYRADSFTHRELVPKAVYRRDGELVAAVLAPNGALYFVMSGDRVADGMVQAVEADAVAFQAVRVVTDTRVSFELVRFHLFPNLGSEQTPWEPVAPDDSAAEPVTVRFLDDDIHTVLFFLAEASGLSMAIGEDVSGQVRLSAVDVPWDSLLEHVLRDNGLWYWLDRGFVRVVPEADIRDDVAAGDYTGDMISLRIVHGSLADVVDLLAVDVGGREVRSELSLDLLTTAVFVEVPWTQALEGVLATHGLAFDDDGARVTIRSEPEATRDD